MPTLISSQQTSYLKNRFIGESGRLISDTIEISDWLNIEGLLNTMDIEKAFDSLRLEKSWIWQKFYYKDRDFIKRSTLMVYKWWSNYPIF